MSDSRYPYDQDFQEGLEESIEDLCLDDQDCAEESIVPIFPIGGVGDLGCCDESYIVGPPGPPGPAGPIGPPGPPSQGGIETEIVGNVVLISPTQVVISLPGSGSSQVTLMSASSMIQIVGSLKYAFTVTIKNLSGFDLTIVPDPFTSDTIDNNPSYTIPSFGNGAVSLTPYSSGWGIS